MTEDFVSADDQGGKQVEKDEAIGQIGIAFFYQGNHTDSGK